MSSFDLLKKLTDAFGTPGNEGEIRQIIREELSGLADFSYDKNGSIICKRNGNSSSPKIMLAGHMDEVGFIVQNITKDGFIKFHNLGGWWNHTLLAQKVRIRNSNGENILGIIGAKPVHHLSKDERSKVLDMKNMCIDIGAKDKEQVTEEFGIQLGDHIVPLTELTPMRNERLVSGKAFDDRVGVSLFIETIKHFADQELPNQLYGVGTVQEEVGTRGAQTAPDVIDPDVAIVLEGTPADDGFGFKESESQGAMGGGPQIRLFDPTIIVNKKLAKFVVDTAKENDITHQVAVRVSGGTDARQIHLHRSGVPTIIISVPARYIHSHVGMMSLDDYENSLKLLIELMKNLDAETVNSFVDYEKY